VTPADFHHIIERPLDNIFKGFFMQHSILLENISQDDLYLKMREIISEELNKRLKPEVPQLYITKKEVGTRLRCSRPTIDRLTAEGHIKGYKINRRVLYRADEIDQALIQIQTLKYKRG
jgi:excisionase family DNA binding protein